VIVCVCKGVTDRQIRQEASAGHPVDEVLRRTGAGSSCGSCRFVIARMVAQEHARAAARAGAAVEAKQDAA
jgi:bacterioferritin-associated ferredoxin